MANSIRLTQLAFAIFTLFTASSINCYATIDCDFNTDGLCSIDDLDEGDISACLSIAGSENIGHVYPCADFDLSGENTLFDWTTLHTNFGQGDFDFSGIIDQLDRDHYIAARGVVPIPAAAWLSSSDFVTSFMFSLKCRQANTT